jgi:hypothetical protein
VVGGSVAFAPVFRLLVLGPRQTWFNLIEYHTLFRRLYWPETTQHDLEVLTSWIDSGPALLTGLLAIAGLWTVARSPQCSSERKGEFYLCAWLSAAIAFEAGLAHPTFPRYFALAMPFLAILTAAGVYAAKLQASARVPITALALLLSVGLARSVYDRRRTEDSWSAYERLARKVDEVTPRGAPVLAEEPIYFLTRRTPPSGFELYYTHKIDVPASERALLHVVTEEEIRRMVRANVFATVYTCDADQVQAYGLRELYSRSVEMDDCTIFWDRRVTSP